MHKSEHKKETLIRIAKRDDLARSKAVCIRLLAVILSLVICGIIIVVLTGLNPFGVYQGIIDGAVGNKRRFWITIRESLILLLIAIGLTPAFKMRFWNIGAEGQILAGGIAAAALMIYQGESMSPWILFPLMLIASALAGLVWGLIPAIFKAIWNTNETLFTLMMNYIAMQVVNYCIILWETPKGSNTIGTINQASKAGWLPAIFGLDYGWMIILVALAAVVMYVYMKYSKQGFEITVVGSSENTANYSGMNVRKIILRTMAISGAICGLAGFMIVSGTAHTISTSTAGGRGFTAIIAAWMSKFNIAAMALISFFLVFMENGAVQIASQFNLNENASSIIIGVILFFLIGCEFFIDYQVKFGGMRKGGKNS